MEEEEEQQPHSSLTDSHDVSFQVGHDPAALTTPPPNEQGENGKPSLVKNKHLSGAGVTRTPTPFKRALAELRKQTVDPYGSGHLVDDITEIIDKENGKGAKGGAADSMYETDMSGNATGIKVEEMDGGESKRTARKVRKSLLASAWEMSDLPYLAETPVSAKYYIAGVVVEWGRPVSQSAIGRVY